MENRKNGIINTDVLIIGAGLLGCFTARNLKRYDIDVAVLEKEDDVCRGISKANTGIIYAGYDNKPGTEKQKLCVQANEDFDRLCEELGVPFSRPGSLPRFPPCSSIRASQLVLVRSPPAMRWVSPCSGC